MLPAERAAGRRLLRVVFVMAGVALLVSVALFTYRNLFADLGRRKNHRKDITEATAATRREAATKRRSGPLVWEEHLRDLPRPEYLYTPAGAKRSDRRHLAQRALKEAQQLREKGITFRVIVFAWKRRASLKRLTDSLRRAEYHGFPVHLDVHMDGGAHPRVIEFVDQLEWSYGRIRVHHHAERVGLERTIMESWHPVSDQEFAFFFEDDIEVSPRFFEYALVALHKYILPRGERASPPSVWMERLVGISLNTPRYDEINMPARDWVPAMAIGETESQFLFQLPCSWGALYFPWLWRDFLQYYRWRRENTPEALHDSIPDAATMHWRRSWKKYLIEHMYMRGLVMLYPSLPRQLSLSTHHREPGEHTDAKPEEPLVDDLGTLILDYFTVPLLMEAHGEYFDRLLAEMKPLRELPIVSFHHERVSSVHSLSQLGLYTMYLMSNAGWDHSRYIKNPGCILDSITFPVASATPTDGEKYLLYEPQWSLSHQMDALRNAAAFARILNRTLITPPWVAPHNGSITAPLERLVTLHHDGEFVRLESLEGFARTHHGWIERIVQFVPWKERHDKKVQRMRDELLIERGLVPAQQAILHAFPTNEVEIRGNFSACQDQVLVFRHLHGSFTNFTTETEQTLFTRWIDKNLHFASPVIQLIEHVRKTIPTPLSCVVYSRGDAAKECGRNVMRLKEPTAEQKLIAFRSCNPTLERTLQYAIEDATVLNMTLSALYVLTDIPDGVPAAIPRPSQTVSGTSKRLHVFSKWDVFKEVDRAVGLSDLPDEIKMGIAELVEASLCRGAQLFLGNIYSSLSNRTMASRDRSLPSNILGLKITPPPPSIQ